MANGIADGSVELQLIGISKRYDSMVAVQNFSLSIAKGEYVSLLGPSGCGKTTTLRVIAGFATPDEGRVVVGSKDVTSQPPYRRNIGLVFQNYALFPHLSVIRNVEFGPRMSGLPSKEIRERADWALGLVRLRGLDQRLPSQLSGGQQQRVAVARVLATRPSIVLLDEPFSNLDARLRQDMQAELRELQQQLGVATIHVTHDQEEAMAMSDRIVVMNRGIVMQEDKPNALYQAPRSPFVAEFMGRCNKLSGVIDGSVGECSAVRLSSGERLVATKLNPAVGKAGSVVDIFFRPECTAVRRSSDPGVTGDNVLKAKVKRLVFLGPTAILHVQLQTGDTILAQFPSADFDSGIAVPNTDVDVSISPTRLMPYART